MIPTEFLNKPRVIEAMLPNLGLTAIVRSLGSWTACGFLSNDKIKQLNQVVDIITNETQVKNSMLHPIQILEALKTYIKGRGFKGNLTWNPIQKITDALDKAFYMSFKNVVPTGKNIMLAIDISGSMTWDGNANSILTPREISCAMAMVTARTEKNYVIKGFATDFIDLDVSPSMTLGSITEYVDKLQMGSTDCSLPMKYATENKMDIDAFIVYTDNETNSGGHPSVALKDYRKKCNKPNAKLIVCGITATDFTIADPSDPNMYDVVGGSSELPSLISTLLSL
jgi:60 kDa SS-A/Ro ribonucleoprotein